MTNSNEQNKKMWNWEIRGNSKRKWSESEEEEDEIESVSGHLHNIIKLCQKLQVVTNKQVEKK